MSENSNQKNDLKHKNFDICQTYAKSTLTQNSIDESIIHACQKIQIESQMLGSISSKLESDLGKNLKHPQRDLALKPQENTNSQSDSITIIHENDTQVSVNSINNLQTKMSTHNFESDRIENQQEFMLDNSTLSQYCVDKFSICQMDDSQPQKYQQSESDQYKSFLPSVPLNQSHSVLNDDYDHDCNESTINSPIFQMTKSESNSIKSFLRKKVAFQDLSFKSSLQQLNCSCNNEEKSTKQSFSFEKSQAEQMISSQPAYKSDQSSSQKVTKSILKRSKTFELNCKKEKEDQHEIQAKQSNMDFCNIRNEELIQILLENETYNSKYLRKYFFSDMTTKISSSGERKKALRVKQTY